MSEPYIYKWYSDEVFNGVLDVVNPFSLNEEINSAGSQIELELGISFQDADPELTTDLLLNEDGDFITTEQLESIILATDILIPGFPSLNDRIEVWNDNNILFNGLVSSWNSDYQNATTKITVISYGVKLDNYIVQILPNESIASQLTYTDLYTIYGEYKTPTYDRLTEVSQTFTVPANTDITGVYLLLAKLGSGTGSGIPATLQIIEDTPSIPGAVLATQTVQLSSDTTTLTLFQFSTAVSLLQGETYHIKVTSPYGSNLSETSLITAAYNSAGGYSDGQVYLSQDISGLSTPGTDLYFELLSATGGVGNTFSSEDPGAIVRELLDNFVSLGGTLTYDTSTVELSGTLVSYTFKFNTYLEAIKKCAELAPANWWWRVDPATSIVYFKPLATEVDHRFILGKHIHNLNLSYSLEQIKNVGYFSGGDDGTGTNVLISSQNNDSIERYGTWLSTASDNRVTTEDTATTLNDSIINRYKDPRFKTVITIPSTEYDTNSVKIGDIIGFGNSNSVIDSLQLQVMQKQTTLDQITLTLDILPPNVSKRIEDIKRNLEKQQTENNPLT